MKNNPSLESLRSVGISANPMTTNIFCHLNGGFQVLEWANVHRAWYLTRKSPSHLTEDPMCEASGDKEVVPPPHSQDASGSRVGNLLRTVSVQVARCLYFSVYDAGFGEWEDQGFQKEPYTFYVKDSGVLRRTEWDLLWELPWSRVRRVPAGLWAPQRPLKNAE